MKPTLESVRACLDGATPAVLATCALDGIPNVTFLSQATFVDPEHIALSFQFFNKTRKNVLVNPRAQLLVWHPVTAEMFRLDLRYLRTESEGGTFERMRAMLAGVASHTGMSEVFSLRGADIYHVVDITSVPARTLAPQGRAPSRLAGLRAAIERAQSATHYEALLQESLAALTAHLDVTHAMVLAHDAPRARLYAIASVGYPSTGVGAEIALGEGVAGVAARERVTVRLTHVTSDRRYLSAMRGEIERHGSAPTREVPWPGLAAPGSQVAAPIVAGRQLLGVLFAESPREGRFTHDDEDALSAFAAHMGVSMLLLTRPDEDAGPPPQPEPAVTAGLRAVVRHFREDDSVFVDDEYVIKGVAGAILWTLLREYVDKGRTTFTNRELRLDPRIRLPEIGDNLEARLVLLRRRLSDREACIRLERVGRGRLRLEVDRALDLVEVC